MEVKGTETVGRLFHALRRLQELGSLPLYELGLTRQQAVVLMMMSAPPEWERPPELPLRVSDLARRLDVSPAAVSQMLTGLESRGLIERRTSKTDRRAVEVFPTEKGEELARLVQDNFDRLHARLLERMTPDEREAFVNLVARIQQLVEQETKNLCGAEPAEGEPDRRRFRRRRPAKGRNVCQANGRSTRS